MDAKKILKSNLVQLVFVLIGASGGFLYWKFIGCESGTCMIKSVWYWSTLWGASVGYLVGDIISGFLNKNLNKGGEKK